LIDEADRFQKCDRAGDFVGVRAVEMGAIAKALQAVGQDAEEVNGFLELRLPLDLASHGLQH